MRAPARISFMISLIQGKILEKSDDCLIIQAGGLGYEVFVPSRAMTSFKTGEEVCLHTHFHVREDSQSLYGFLSKDEKDLFKMLIAVSGIGPKSGLAALSAAPYDELIRAISHEDHAVFQSVSGIGPKTAKRLVLELKNKVIPIDFGSADSSSGVSARHEVIAALEQLGYNSSEIRAMISDLDLSDLSVEDAVKLALKKN